MSHPPIGKAVKLLENAGYNVIDGKQKIPINVWVNDREMQSRLYIDFLARTDKELFIVKLARARQPINWTGPAIRDQFFMYVLLYKEMQGLLYVDPEAGTIKKIQFEWDQY